MAKASKYLPRPHLRDEDTSTFGMPDRSCHEAPAHDDVTRLLENVDPEVLRREAKECRTIRATQFKKSKR